MIHEKLSQTEKIASMKEFQNKNVSILVATDLVSRGLDFETNVSRVIQLDFARTVDIHYNRVGRTARAGNKGLAVNFYMSNSIPLAQRLMDVIKTNDTIEQLYKKKIKNRMTRGARKEILKRMSDIKTVYGGIGGSLMLKNDSWKDKQKKLDRHYLTKQFTKSKEFRFSGNVDSKAIEKIDQEEEISLSRGGDGYHSNKRKYNKNIKHTQHSNLISNSKVYNKLSGAREDDRGTNKPPKTDDIIESLMNTKLFD